MRAIFRRNPLLLRINFNFAYVKTLHFFLVKRYIPPFLATLFIAVFVFFMVFVFTYIDEIAGKGVDNWTLAQLFFYTFVTFIPSSMPLAILLSSIMTFGNLGENYELAALKSTGLSLMQIMKPLLVFIIFLSGLCFVFSNYTLPFIHLKQGRLLYDVREAKPALKIKEGIFYNEVDGYTMRVGQKDEDGQTIRNILVYDHTERRGNIVQTYADSGKIEMGAGNEFLQMTLHNGNRYQQFVNDEVQKKTRPMMSLSFKEQQVKFDLSGFKMQKTDEELFKNNAEMMNLSQLDNALDTLKKEQQKAIIQTQEQFRNYFNINAQKLSNKVDSLKLNSRSVYDYINVLDPVTKKQLIENALNMARSCQAFLESKEEQEYGDLQDEARYKTNWQSKFTLSFACIVLFFVGAPLGAIVRKGGFGMPVVISVVLFIIFHVISFSCKKLALRGEMDTFVGMWLASWVFLPIGIWLTIQASRDSSLFEIANYTQPIIRFFKRFKKKEA
jgi:lipopolysaccharide export system permease protein